MTILVLCNVQWRCFEKKRKVAYCSRCLGSAGVIVRGGQRLGADGAVLGEALLVDGGSEAQGAGAEQQGGKENVGGHLDGEDRREDDVWTG